MAEKPAVDIRKDVVKLVATLTGKTTPGTPSSKPSTSESKRRAGDDAFTISSEERFGFGIQMIFLSFPKASAWYLGVCSLVFATLL